MNKIIKTMVNIAVVTLVSGGCYLVQYFIALKLSDVFVCGVLNRSQSILLAVVLLLVDGVIVFVSKEEKIRGDDDEMDKF